MLEDAEEMLACEGKHSGVFERCVDGGRGELYRGREDCGVKDGGKRADEVMGVDDRVEQVDGWVDRSDVADEKKMSMEFGQPRLFKSSDN
jgi:hypothetical protein